MKVFVPRNIEKGLFNMNFQVGPVSISLIQLVLVAAGVGIGMVIWNGVTRTGGSPVIAGILAAPIALIFFVIAFYRQSELGLVALIAKIWRNRFLDTTKKVQTNEHEVDNLKVIIQETHATYEKEQKQDKKTKNPQDLQTDRLNSDDLLS